MSAKILTVDSGADVRHLIEIRLKQAGYQVITAANGNDCYRLLTMLAGHHPPVYNSDTHDPHLPANGSDSLDKSLQELLAEIIPPDLQALVSNNSLSGLKQTGNRLELEIRAEEAGSRLSAVVWPRDGGWVSDPATAKPQENGSYLSVFELPQGLEVPDIESGGWSFALLLQDPDSHAVRKAVEGRIGTPAE